MNKIDLLNQYTLTEEQQNQKNELVKIMLKNPSILEWIKNNNYPIEDLETETSYFNDYLSALNICNKCQGLKDCPYNNKGFYQELQYDSFLSFKLAPCRYNYDSEITHVKYIKNWFLDKKDLLNSFDNMELPIDDSNYLNTVAQIKKIVKEGKKGLYIWGSYGVGKTYLLSCIANYFAKQNKTVSSYYITDFANKVLTSLNSQEIKRELMNDMKKCDILLLDDIGSGKMGPWLRDDWLNSILTHRMNNHLLTYFSSNFKLADLRVKLNESGSSEFNYVDVSRLVERIETLADPIKLDGKNWRKNGK